MYTQDEEISFNETFKCYLKLATTEMYLTTDYMTFTTDLEEAMHFQSKGQALDYLESLPLVISNVLIIRLVKELPSDINSIIYFDLENDLRELV